MVMQVRMTEEVLGNGLRTGHAHWLVRYQGWDEVYQLRLEKVALNSDSYRLIFSTATGQAWDVAIGRNATELMDVLRFYFPKDLVVC